MGVLTHAEITAHRLRFTSDPAFQPDFDQLYDLREVTSIAATVEQIREIASHSPFSSKSRRAIVATRDAIYGMARMFALQHAGHYPKCSGSVSPLNYNLDLTVCPAALEAAAAFS